jgi:hypothetical protein
MAYIGNIPAESFISFEKQVFTIVNSQTAYTLSHSVVNENDIRLVINNVVQEPGSGKAYTASGTTLTLSAALTNGTDTMYCVFLGRALQTVNPPNASVGSDQTAPTIITGQTAETSIATDDTILIHDTSASALRKMTRANFVSGIGGTNTPAFHVELASSQTVSDATWTKVAFDTEVIDTNNAFDLTTNDRFTVPSGEAGKYLIYGSIAISGSSNSSVDIGRVAPYKNGSAVIECSFNNRTEGYTRGEHLAFSVLIDLAVSDYLEMYGQSDVTTGTPKFGGAESANVTFFGGYKLIG